MLFYDDWGYALSFVTPVLIKALPVIHFSLSLLLAGLTLGFLTRIVLTWYPQIDVKSGVWPIFIVPTEPVLSFSRRFVPAIGGVDVTPVIWVGIISLLRELIVGQQGILSQLLRNAQILSR
tara:strand:+ start:989 stop:1351 length:363 start_codon:yes stop_codon:yes gene_type:complete